jgi:hypothetical protein
MIGVLIQCRALDVERRPAMFEIVDMERQVGLVSTIWFPSLICCPSTFMHVLLFKYSHVVAFMLALLSS